MRLLFHSPNVHTGGGLRLMQDAFELAPGYIKWAQIDMRAQSSIEMPADIDIHIVRKSLLGRLAAEWRLLRCAKVGDTILCFHGLPPLFPSKAETVIFLQNKLLIETSGLHGYPLPVRARLMLERFWFRLIRNRRFRYIVQTPSMAEMLKKRLGPNIVVSVLPFANFAKAPAITRLTREQKRRYDFVYVSSGETHKNHLKLIEAWSLLAFQGMRPSLALTIDKSRYANLCADIESTAVAQDLNIQNLGTLPREDIQALYNDSSALIFPSTTESFGLPLIEAAEAGLPILAPELDYVRDIVTPTSTFDANSSRSIARAVLRYQGHPEQPIEVVTAAEFLASIAQ